MSVSSPLVRHARGITLVELLVTLSVIAILMAVAAPAFTGSSNSARAASASNALLASLNLARSEAIRLGTNVSVCTTANPNATNPSCDTAANWERGWLVFVDDNLNDSTDNSDGNRSRDTGEKLLKVFQPSPSGLSAVGSSNLAHAIGFLRRGDAQGADGNIPSGSIAICAGDVLRSLTLNAQGLSRVSKGNC